MKPAVRNYVPDVRTRTAETRAIIFHSPNGLDAIADGGEAYAHCNAHASPLGIQHFVRIAAGQVFSLLLSPRQSRRAEMIAAQVSLPPATTEVAPSSYRSARTMKRSGAEPTK